MLVILTPQAMTDATRTAEYLKPYAKLGGKPVLASWMGGAGVAAGEQILNAAGIPTFPYPDTAARLFNYMWRYSLQPARLCTRRRATPPAATARTAPRPPRSSQKVKAEGRDDSHRIRVQAGPRRLRHPDRRPAVIAATEDEAVAAAEAIGYPVVLKLHSETITHKTDVGGVQLNLKDADAGRAAPSADSRLGDRPRPARSISRASTSSP